MKLAVLQVYCSCTARSSCLPVQSLAVHCQAHDVEAVVNVAGVARDGAGQGRAEEGSNVAHFLQAAATHEQKASLAVQSQTCRCSLA